MVIDRFKAGAILLILAIIVGLCFIVCSSVVWNYKQSVHDYYGDWIDRWEQSEDEKYKIIRQYDADLKRFMNLAANFYYLLGRYCDLDEMLGKCVNRWEACLTGEF